MRAGSPSLRGPPRARHHDRRDVRVRPRRGWRPFPGRSATWAA